MALITFCFARQGYHPAVASALNNLGAVHKAMGQLEPAGAAYQEASDIYHLIFSADHKSTLTAKHNLALLFKAKGDLLSAEGLSQSVLELHRAKEEPDHHAIAASLGVLGAVSHAKGELEASESYLTEAMEVHTKNETEGSTQAAAVLNDFGLLRRDQGQISNAMEIMETVVGLRLRLLGAKHPEFAVSVHNLKAIYDEAGSREKAEALGELLEKYEYVDATNETNEIELVPDAAAPGSKERRGRVVGGKKP